MPSIVNGLFAGRSGIASHGTAIAVIGDNLANASTIGFKAARAEFEDLIAGGQTSGKTIGSGAQLAAVSTIFEQGTLEFTGRSLDMAVDGNGFFVVEAESGNRFYTRAGNFKVDESGILVDQHGYDVLGFPANGSGALEQVNVNSISQSNVATRTVDISGNVDQGTSSVISNANLAALDALVLDVGTEPATEAAEPATYSDISAQAEFQTVVEVFDSIGESHTVTYFFFKDDSDTDYHVRAYVNNEDVDSTAVTWSGYPRQIASGSFTMTFANGDGSRSDASAALATDATLSIQFNNGSNASSIAHKFDFTSYATNSTIDSITQDGQGVGAVTSVSVGQDGTIFAQLNNGQSATIGTLGLVNFSSPEALARVGKNLLQQSTDSGEPIVGQPTSGTFGAISSGSIELSTTDIANEFVKLITLQRGFQANSRIITTINQLLNEIIQLA